MLGSHVLDLALGLIFLFMTVSLAASAITEAISSLLKLRHGTLKQGIMALLNDKEFNGLALQLYNNALINPLGSGLANSARELTTMPAYISGKRFSEAFVETLSKVHGQKPLSELIDAITDEQIKQALTTLYNRAQHDERAFLSELETWFDDAMDRLSGWYKRQTQFIGFLAAFVVCILLNADALRIGTMLWQAPSLQVELTSASAENAKDAIDILTHASLLGWTKLDVFDGTFLHPASIVFGWLIVAVASLLGAPFWFDTLQRIAQIAGNGPASQVDKKKDRR
jgi:hypothetical protein